MQEAIVLIIFAIGLGCIAVGIHIGMKEPKH
jgi:hypothetical protein